MAGAIGTFRFGQDGQSRIASSVQMLMEATDLYPFEIRYQELVPFYPPEISGGLSQGAAAGAIGSGGSGQFKQYPARLDIYCWLGDDVVIPLNFYDPDNPNTDMSQAAGYVWRSQLRVYHDYQSRLVNEFSIESQYTPPDPTVEGDVGITQVWMFLSRIQNKYRGVYAWDLQATSPADRIGFPEPPGIPDSATWPPMDSVRTWLYGNMWIIPRTTATDVLPAPPGSTTNGAVMVIPVTTNGWAVGPNGRVL